MTDQTAASAPPQPGLAAALREMVRPKAAEIERDIDFTAPGGAALGRDVGVFDPARMARFDVFTRAVVAAVAIVTFAGAWAKGMTIEFGDAALAFQIAGFMTLAAVLYRVYRPAPRLSAGAAMIAEQMIYGVLFIFYSYVALGFARSEYAPLLSRLDAALGFDWSGYKAALESNPAILGVLRECYASIVWQNLLVPTALIACGRLGWARVFMNGYALGAALCISIAALAPALDAQAFYKFGGIADLPLKSGLPITDDYLGLRRGDLATLDFAKLTGIVSFPSFHTYLGFLYGFCALQLKRLRWVLIPVNVLLVVATPKFGLHFLVDVIGGALVASAALWAIHRFLRPRESAA